MGSREGQVLKKPAVISVSLEETRSQFEKAQKEPVIAKNVGITGFVGRSWADSNRRSFA